ncbi:MAG: ubiquinone biosynthesis protein UbiB, partial [Rhizobiales bacterium]|nr:ubiquinone biosynthesis protein UbiB [Hyphomicrobiales bacterium]
RTLNPNLNMWKTAEPVVRGWIERTLGPIGKLEEAGESLRDLARLALQLPQLLEESHKAMQVLAATRLAEEQREQDSIAGLAPWQLAAILFGTIFFAILLVEVL